MAETGEGGALPVSRAPRPLHQLGPTCSVTWGLQPVPGSRAYNQEGGSSVCAAQGPRCWGPHEHLDWLVPLRLGGGFTPHKPPGSSHHVDSPTRQRAAWLLPHRRQPRPRHSSGDLRHTPPPSLFSQVQPHLTPRWVGSTWELPGDGGAWDKVSWGGVIPETLPPWTSPPSPIARPARPSEPAAKLHRAPAPCPAVLRGKPAGGIAHWEFVVSPFLCPCAEEPSLLPPPRGSPGSLAHAAAALGVPGVIPGVSAKTQRDDGSLPWRGISEESAALPKAFGTSCPACPCSSGRGLGRAPFPSAACPTCRCARRLFRP